MKRLEINKNDLKNNIDIIKRFASQNENNGKEIKIIAVVKANGVGLDILQCSKVLIENGIEILAVAVTEEAVVLRNAGIENEIVMLSPTVLENELKLLIENDVTLTISSKYQAELVEKIAIDMEKEEVKVHIKIDTGLSRFGIIYDNMQEIIEIFKNAKRIKVVGTYTHFSKPEYTKWTNLQFDRFMKCLKMIEEAGYNPGIRHAAESTAFLMYPEIRLDAVRIGSAFQGRTLMKIDGLVKLGTFKSAIVEIKTLPKGYNVSYGNSYKTKKVTKVATIPVGYIDGFNKDKLRDDFTFKNNLIAVGMEIKKIFKDNSLKVKINGKYYKVIGRIGMYHSVVDITGSEDINVGDEVILDITPLQANDGIRREYI